MLMIMAVLEDGQLMAHIDGDHWEVALGDGLFGKQAQVKMTNSELAAVLALAIGFGEDNINSPATKILYPIAEATVEGLDKELRLFP